MKKFIAIISFLTVVLTLSAQETRKDQNDNFMPKGDKAIGVQVSYLDLGSTDSDFLMLLQNFNATGSMFSFAPYFSYAYKDNKALGARIRYMKMSGGVDSADLSLFSDDLSFSASDITADSRSLMFEVFRRSYMGLDKQGRFGLFNDISLAYVNSRNVFNTDSSTDAYSQTQKMKLGIRPGLMIFILNNVSTQVTLGIGGVSASQTDYYENGEKIGQKRFTRAHFAPDITDITFGMTIHL